MENKSSIYLFLQTKGFKLVDHYEPKVFDNYTDIFQDHEIQIIFSCDRSFESIGLSKLTVVNKEYDLQIIKSFLLDEVKLSYVFPITEQITFLQDNFVDICKLFSDEQYSQTKIKLEKLYLIRGSQMFPGWFKNE